MDIQLGITGSETTFNYVNIDYEYQVEGTKHIVASGGVRLQIAPNQKYIFYCEMNYASSDVWDNLISEFENSKTNDLNLIIGEDNYTVRFDARSFSKTPIRGTAEGYLIEFDLVEV